MTSPGLIPMSLRLLSSTRCRMSGPYPISSRHCSYNWAFGIPRCASAYLRKQESFEGVFIIGESTVGEEVIGFWVSIQEWVGVVGKWRLGEDCVWAIDAKLERICEIDANADSSNSEGTWPGVDVEVRRRHGTTEDLRFIGSNVCECGGAFDDVVPSYCDQHNEVTIIRSIKRNQVAYHCPSPFLHHKWCQGHRIAHSRVDIGISGVVIICIFLLENSPKTSEFELNLRISSLWKH